MLAFTSQPMAYVPSMDLGLFWSTDFSGSLIRLIFIDKWLFGAKEWPLKREEVLTSSCALTFMSHVGWSIHQTQILLLSTSNNLFPIGIASSSVKVSIYTYSSDLFVVWEYPSSWRRSWGGCTGARGSGKWKTREKAGGNKDMSNSPGAGAVSSATSH